ncbi:hypothetical protein F4703DRAFT_1126337 [Phycomyces blakesleeanus]
MSLKKPISDEEMHDKIFVDSTSLKEILEKRFGPCSQSPRQIEAWVNKTNKWGQRKAVRHSGKMVEGRTLWVLKDKFLEVDAMNDLTKYHSYLRVHPMTTIGYARKSPGKESLETRCSLLQKMADRLKNRCLCTKIFVSPSSKADEPLMVRDSKKDCSKYLNVLIDCVGNMNDLCTILDRKFKPVRLVIIDYAGLSTEPNNVRDFFSRYTQVKGLVIDHGLTFEILKREDLLENEDILSRFDCRSNYKHRST